MLHGVRALMGELVPDARVLPRPWWLGWLPRAITLGRTVYIPPGWEPAATWPVLAHELVHLMRGGGSWWRRAWWLARYAFPQCLGLLALLAFVSPWFLVALVALAPWPAGWRLREEAAAFAVSLYVASRVHNSFPQSHAYYAEVLSGWPYWWCAWRRDTAVAALSSAAADAWVAASRGGEVPPHLWEPAALPEAVVARRVALLMDGRFR